MAHIRIDISDGDVIEKSEEKPAEKVPERRRDAPEITDLQIVEIVPTPEIDGGFPAWRIPEILEIIDRNRGSIKKKPPDLPV